MIRKLAWLIRKEFLQIARTPALAVILVLCPVALTGVIPFGLGDDAGIRVEVVDPAGSGRGAELAARLEASGHIAAAGLSDSQESSEKKMAAGRLEAIVLLPPDGGDPALIIDGTHAPLAFEATYYTVRELYDVEGMQEMVANVQRVYTSGKGSTHYYLVTMLVFLLALVGCCLPMLSVVWELESRRLGQIRSTGTGAGFYLLSKVLFCTLLSLAELLGGLLIARWVHGFSCAGSLAAFFLLAVIFLLAVGNLGALLALYGKTQIRCIYLFVFVFILLVMLSTMFAPLDNMSPAWAATRYVNPLFWMVDGSWKVLLKGAGLADILPHCGVLLAIGLALAVINVRGLRRQ